MRPSCTGIYDAFWKGVSSLDREHITRYVRPEDVPLVDRSILEPMLSGVAKEMSASFPHQGAEEWVDDLQKALLRGDIVIVIDDVRKRLGMVRTDEPPFSGLVDPNFRGGLSGVSAADPLNLKEWQGGSVPPRSPEADEEGPKSR